MDEGDEVEAVPCIAEGPVKVWLGVCEAVAFGDEPDMPATKAFSSSLIFENEIDEGDEVAATPCTAFEAFVKVWLIICEAIELGDEPSIPAEANAFISFKTSIKVD